MERLILIGAGGYSKSVLDSINTSKYKIEGFIDEFSENSFHLGYKIFGKSLNSLDDYRKYVYFICIGNNKSRKLWYNRLTNENLKIINVIDKSAILSKMATLGNGCFIGKMAIVNSKAIIGNNCIINTRALVEHGCHVGNHVNISTNSVINGDVIVREGSFIGSCSVVIGQKSIGKWSTVGAGSVVIKSIGDGVTVAGVPSKFISNTTMLG